MAAKRSSVVTNFGALKLKVDIQRRIDRIAGQIICGILSLVPRYKPHPRGYVPRNILVIMLSEMGSVVLAQPMFSFLSERYPHARIYALLFQRNRECLELFDSVPSEDILTIRDDSFQALTGDVIRAILRMRAIGVDAVIDCELFSRISSILSFLSGAKLRVGFHPHTQEGLYRGSFINRPVLYNPYHHISTQFITLAYALNPALGGAPTVKRKVRGEALFSPRLTIAPEAIESFRDRLTRDFPGVGARKLALLYPGGGLLPIRAWPEENFSAVARDLIRNGYAVGIIGLKGDNAVAARIVSRISAADCFDLTGYTRTLRELITLFHLAALLITNDGGPGHFASLTPMPAIVLFGPETPVLYGPIGKQTLSLYAGLSCSPCLTAYNHRNSPCDGNNVCLKAISPKMVLREAYRLLAPPSETSVSDG